MTDTRKEFEDWFLSQYGKKPMPSPKNGDEPHTNTYMTMFADGANKGWHACQSLNDKRIEQLLAVIELQRNALQSSVDCGMVPVSSAKEGGAARHSQYVIVADKIRSALALQPSDVELVDASNISDDEWNRYKSTGEGIKFYTIKTKADKK